MDHSSRVTVLDAVAQLAHPDTRLLLRYPPLLPNDVEQVSTRRLFHDDVDPSVGLDRLEEDDEVRVLEQLNDVDLSREELLDVVVRRSSLRYDLNRYVGFVLLRVGQLHGGVRAVTEVPDDRVSVSLEYGLFVLLSNASGIIVSYFGCINRLFTPTIFIWHVVLFLTAFVFTIIAAHRCKPQLTRFCTNLIGIIIIIAASGLRSAVRRCAR